MKATNVVVFLGLLTWSWQACADGHQPNDSEILAKRGEGVVTHELFDARVHRIPEYDRAQFLRDRRRVQEMLSQLLLQTQLVEEARKAGLQDDPDVQARMRLAADEELAKAWMQRYPNLREPADYELMAREHYTVNPGRFMTEKTVELTHILVGMEDRSEEDALILAQELHERIEADPGIFDELVAEYSDDPSAASNHGHFKQIKRGQMVKPFEDVAFEMAEGEISEPVRTVYGYHIIRLDGINPPRAQSFEEVRFMLVKRMRKRHEDRVRNDHLSYLSNQNVEMTSEALEAMVERYFDEEALNPEPGSANGESE